jgi:heparosan-N-sulfate-glucuronate 5-epimerase
MTSDTDPAPRSRLPLRRPSYTGFFSSARTHPLPIGSRVRRGELGGYYVDFGAKVDRPGPLTDWLRTENHVVLAQWGLACFERHLKGEGEAWLTAAVEAAGHLADTQVREGVAAGGWLHARPMRHTFHVEPPWLSAMAQGEGASLLVRAHAATGDDRFAEAAGRALRPMASPKAAGGVRVSMGRGFFLEEYPTDPPSLVLNGGVFALWGYYDVAIGLGDEQARREFESGVDTLAANIDRWDTGAWSRYDLFPRRITNVASAFYHDLHINQLGAMQLIAPRPELAAARERFERYRSSRIRRAGAFARKAAFRVLVPRHPSLAHRSPFTRPRGTG